MNWADAFGAAAGHLFSWPGILIPVAGTLLSMLASFLPGVGNTSIVVLVMVGTMTWDPVSVLLMFGALTGGATFMGSITAILFNIPGNVSSTPALLDGHPMARAGLPRTAIACAATASAVGSVFGVLVLLAVLPVVQPLLLAFGPLERLLVGLWGLVTVVCVPTSSRLKSGVMALAGLLAASIGADPGSSGVRWTFGHDAAATGLNIVAVMLGLFTLAELVDWMRSWKLQAVTPPSPEDGVRPGILAVFRHLGLTIRASSIGTLVGMIPGVGGTVAGFVAYGHAVQTSSDRSRFGQGDIRGVVAPEAAVDAKDGGSLLPALAFGLPGSEAGVALLAVFAIHGLVPGLPMLTTQLPLTLTLIFALLFSNLLTSVVGVGLTPWLARLRSLPVERIALPCLILGLVTVVQLNGVLFDLYTAVAFAVAGYWCRQHGWPRAPFVIAFVLGSLVETSALLTVQLFQLQRLELADRGASLVLALLIVGSLVWMRVHRSSVPHAEDAARADLGLAAVATAVSAALLVWALVHPGPYGVYPLAIASAVAALSLATAVRSWRLCERGRRGLRDVVGALAPSPAHRLPLLLLAVIPLLVWSAGLVAGVALSVLAWYVARGGVAAATWLRALAWAVSYGVICHVFVEYVAHLVLPQGWLWEQFAVKGP